MLRSSLLIRSSLVTLLGLLALLGSGCRPAAPLRVRAGLVPEVVPRWHGLNELLGVHRPRKFAGRELGILFTSGRQRWGTPYDHQGSFRPETASPGELDFGHPVGATVVVYFPSRGEGRNLLRGWQVPISGAPGAYHKFDAARFGLAEARNLGLTRSAQLVEAEVNGGRGGSGLHFVVTRLKVLDDSLRRPLRVDLVLTALRDRFEAWLKQMQPATAALIAPATSGSTSGSASALRCGQDVGVYPYWQKSDDTLEVIFGCRIIALSERVLPPERCAQSGGDPRHGRRRCREHPLTITSFRWDLHLAARYRVSRQGELLAETLYLPIRLH